jgi:CBS domain-containing protein
MDYKKVSEIMTGGVVVIDPDASLQEAAAKMKSIDVGLLPVCDGDKLRGMISDRDIVLRGVAENRLPESTKVKEVMTKHVVFIFEDQDVLEAARLMELKQIRRLVVLNRDKRMTGIVSLGDISLHQHDNELCGEILKEVSEPSTERKRA